MNVIYDDDDVNNHVGGDEANGTEKKERPSKRRRRRRVQIDNMHQPNAETSDKNGLSDLLAISKVMFELRMTKEAEEKLSRAPPPRISFG